MMRTNPLCTSSFHFYTTICLFIIIQKCYIIKNVVGTHAFTSPTTVQSQRIITMHRAPWSRTSLFGQNRKYNQPSKNKPGIQLPSIPVIGPILTAPPLMVNSKEKYSIHVFFGRVHFSKPHFLPIILVT